MVVHGMLYHGWDLGSSLNWLKWVTQQSNCEPGWFQQFNRGLTRSNSPNENWGKPRPGFPPVSVKLAGLIQIKIHGHTTAGYLVLVDTQKHRLTKVINYLASLSMI